jgi:hypothetical protein
VRCAVVADTTIEPPFPAGSQDLHAPGRFE